MKGVTACRNLVSSRVEVVHVADREADIFEFMHACIEDEDSSLVVRSKSNRRIEIVNKGETNSTHLKGPLEGLPVKFRGQISIAGNGKRKDQKAKVSVRANRVTVKIPSTNRTSAEVGTLVPLEVTAILVTSAATVKGEKVKRLLLTY